MTKRGWIIGYMLIGAWASWPVLSVMATALAASILGCVVHEGFVNPCTVLGKDIGPTLYAMGVLGWFMLITIPTGILAFMVFTIVGLLIRAAKSRNRSDANKRMQLSGCSGPRPLPPAGDAGH